MKTRIIVFIQIIFCFNLLANGDQLSESSQYVDEGSDCVVDCPLSINDHSYTLLSWMLPDDSTALSPKDHDVEGGFSLASNGSLLITNATTNMTGTYKCLVEGSKYHQRLGFVKLTVIAVPVTKTGWEENRQKVIQGIIAAVVLAAVFSAGCLIFAYRWRGPKKEDAKDLFSGSEFAPEEVQTHRSSIDEHSDRSYRSSLQEENSESKISGNLGDTKF